MEEIAATIYAYSPIDVIDEIKIRGAGTLYVMRDWQTLIRLSYQFAPSDNLLMIDEPMSALIIPPISDTVFKPHPLGSSETRRFLRAWEELCHQRLKENS